MPGIIPASPNKTTRARPRVWPFHVGRIGQVLRLQQRRRALLMELRSSRRDGAQVAATKKVRYDADPDCFWRPSLINGTTATRTTGRAGRLVRPAGQRRAPARPAARKSFLRGAGRRPSAMRRRGRRLPTLRPASSGRSSSRAAQEDAQKSRRAGRHERLDVDLLLNPPSAGAAAEAGAVVGSSGAVQSLPDAAHGLLDAAVGVDAELDAHGLAI